MKIAVHVEPKANPDSFAPRWIENLKKCDVDVLPLDFHDPEIISKVRGCSGAMWHWFHMPDDKQAAPKILKAIEIGLGIPVFPNIFTHWHYDEKVSQHYLLDAVDAPKIKSWVFWNYEDALKFVEECSYPIIFKLSVGAGSSNVLKLDNVNEAKRILIKMFFEGFFPYTINEFAPQDINFRNISEMKIRVSQALKYLFKREYPPIPWYYIVQKNHAYFQEFLPDNPYDIRITVIGNRAFGFIRHNRPGDFRASGSGKIDHHPNNIPIDAVRIAHEISKKCNFQSMAYDFLYDKAGSLLINEISYCYLNRAVYDCPGYWDRNLRWYEGHVWPEEAHIEDFLFYLKNGEQP